MFAVSNSLHSAFWNVIKNSGILEQECILGGCVPSAAMVIGEGVSAQGICLPRGDGCTVGMFAQGGWLHSGYVCPGGYLPEQTPPVQNS